MRVHLNMLFAACISAAIAAPEAQAHFSCPLSLGGADLQEVLFFETVDGSEYELAPESGADLSLAWLLTSDPDTPLRFVCRYHDGSSIETRLSEGHDVACRTRATHDGSIAEALVCEF